MKDFSPETIPNNPSLTVASTQQGLDMKEVNERGEQVIFQSLEEEEEEGDDVQQCTLTRNDNSFCLVFSNMKVSTYYTPSHHVRLNSFSFNRAESNEEQEQNDSLHLLAMAEHEQNQNQKQQHHQIIDNLDNDSTEKQNQPDTETLSIIDYFNTAMIIEGDNMVWLSKVHENGDTVSLGDYDILAPISRPAKEEP